MICNILPQIASYVLLFLFFSLFATLANNKDERYLTRFITSFKLRTHDMDRASLEQQRCLNLILGPYRVFSGSFCYRLSQVLSLAFPVLYIKFTHKNSVGAGEEGMVVVGMGTYLLGEP